MNLIGAQKERIPIDTPAQGSVRNSEIGKNRVVKLVFSQQQFVNAGEKRARLGALDDTMIVSAANCNRLADSELRQNRRSD